MIQPVKNIAFEKVKKQSKLNKKADNKTYPPLVDSKRNQAFFSKANINFKGYNFIETKFPFEYGIENNFFKLPKVTLENGEVIQIQPDESQLECAKHIYNGKNVVFSAPTGMGKTAIAHYCTQLNLEKGKKTIYTVPIKALANDKFVEFSKIYGDENIGILTGERKINPAAPIVIMTTEIYDNQSFDLNELNSKKIGTVIFDEAHYLADEQRGSAWEYSIINSVPKNIQVLCLSATIGNADKMNTWINGLNSDFETKKVEVDSKNRPVPLVSYLFKEGNFEPLADGVISLDEQPSSRQKRALEIIFQVENDKNQFYQLSEEEYSETFEKLKEKIGKVGGKYSYDFQTFEEKFKKEYKFLDKIQQKLVLELMLEPENKKIKHLEASRNKTGLSDLIIALKEEEMFPAIVFKLAQGSCEDALLSIKNDTEIDLLNEEEKEKLNKILKEYEEKGVYLGSDFDRSILQRGFALHHAGRIPQYKKLIEELFSKKLIKVVFATSTLGAGINMPARTVVMSDMTYKKYNPQTQELEFTPLSANEFHQMAGRAGRRGIDSVGNVVLYNLYSAKGKRNTQRIDELDLAYQLLLAPADDLRSQFRPQTPMIASAIEKNEDIREIVSKSFKMHLSKNPQKDSEAMVKKFENYTQILLKEGYCYKSHKKELSLTPKGKILTMSQGMNPLMLSSLLYDEKLKDCSVLELCQIAGYISGSDNQQEKAEAFDLAQNKLKAFLGSKNPPEEFKSSQKMYKAKEERILKSLKEARAHYCDIPYADSFSGLITYLWADSNLKNNNSIENFEKMINKLPSVAKSEDIELNKDFSRKLTEGNVYKLISQTITTLKQIERICEFALLNEDLYPNSNYWEELSLKAHEAIELMTKEPINNEVNYENKSNK